jgi:hypothetical protein
MDFKQLKQKIFEEVKNDLQFFELYDDDPAVIQETEEIITLIDLSSIRTYLSDHGYENPDQMIINLILK